MNRAPGDALAYAKTEELRAVSSTDVDHAAPAATMRSADAPMLATGGAHPPRRGGLVLGLLVSAAAVVATAFVAVRPRADDVAPGTTDRRGAAPPGTPAAPVPGPSDSALNASALSASATPAAVASPATLPRSPDDHHLAADASVRLATAPRRPARPALAPAPSVVGPAPDPHRGITSSGL